VHDEVDLGHDPSVPAKPSTQYVTEDNLLARQRLWGESTRDRDFDFHAWVLGLAGIGPSDRVLEVGCGNGAYLRRVPQAVGMDLSTGMLDAARRHAGTTLLVNGDAQAIPFADGRFDVVLAPHMLYHVPDRRQAARELRRVLRDGGVCVAATNGSGNQLEMRAMVIDVVGNGWTWNRPSDAEFSMENGAEQLAAGFDSIETIYAEGSTFHVTDPDLFAAYIASIRDHYEDEVSGWISWSDVVEECRRRCAEIVERDGYMAISTSFGAFVCR
jgi:ubiquinone/menaquinone biosynthesis C-methylase UbiE